MVRLSILGFAVLLASCGSGLVDNGELTYTGGSELRTDLVLQFVNCADATVEVLDNDVGLDSRAAKGIVDHVHGADGALGTGDDNPFDTVDELDAIAYVGTPAIAAIEKFAVAKYGSTPTPDPTPSTGEKVTVESVTFSDAEVAEVLDLLNNRFDAEMPKVGLSSSAYFSLHDAPRPFTSIQQVAATKNVGTVALTALKRYVDSQLIPGPTPEPDPSGCVATGGTYDTVKFTQVEECHAVDFMNRARFSEMGALPDKGRLVAYQGKPRLADGSRTWATAAEYANSSGIGTTAVAAVKSAAASWTANGLPYDTVATTWANRSKLLNGPVAFNRVYATKMLPDSAHSGFQCAEIRDTPTAPNYLNLCVPRYICEGAICFPEGVGGYVAADGKLRSGTGNWELVSNGLVYKLANSP
ncbi:MAG: hypothetical protein HY901_29340 [Deltaproteobacteria bacterium]|nr:hypothetical protein [Deltaproteobacteria bacterium]